jgi:protein SCO1/2
MKHRTKQSRAIIVATVLFGRLILATILQAHEPRTAAMPSDRPPEQLKGVQLAPQLGAQWPLDAMLRDETDAMVSLGALISDKPALVLFSYFNCPMLCPVLLEGTGRSLKGVSLRPGRDFTAVIISIDPHDEPADARKKKHEVIRRHPPGGDSTLGWHFLTADPTTIERLTRVAGFRYSYDAASGHYAHPAAMFILTGQGKLARVLYGVDPAPRDLRLALVEASHGGIATITDQLLLFCYHYDPLNGRYGAVIMNALRVAGLATVFVLAGWIWFMLLRERSSGERKTVDV